MLVPDIIFKSLFDITPQTLSNLGIKAVVLDVDNTLRDRGQIDPFSGVIEWVETMKKAGISLSISSNNFSFNIAPFAKKLNIDYISMSCKPFPLGILRAIKKFNINKKNIAIIGDQIYTDILGGHLCGIKSILVFPYSKETGPLWRIKRFFEKPIIKYYYKNKGSDLSES